MAAQAGPIRIREEGEFDFSTRPPVFTGWIAERIPELDAHLAAQELEEADLVSLYADGDTHLATLQEGVQAVTASSQGVDPEALTPQQQMLHDSAALRACILDCLANSDYSTDTFVNQLASGVLPPGLTEKVADAARVILGLLGPDAMLNFIKANAPTVWAAQQGNLETTCGEKCGGPAPGVKGPPLPVPPQPSGGGTHGSTRSGA